MRGKTEQSVELETPYVLIRKKNCKGCAAVSIQLTYQPDLSLNRDACILIAEVQLHNYRLF